MNLHLSWKGFKQASDRARFVFGKLSLARMELEELSSPSEPSVEAGAAAPGRRGPSYPETRRVERRFCRSAVPGPAGGGPRKKRSHVAWEGARISSSWGQEFHRWTWLEPAVWGFFLL